MTTTRFLVALLFFVSLGLGPRAHAQGAPPKPSSLEKIRQRGELIIGSDATYPPFELQVGERFEGFDIDLGDEIGKELGVRVRWQNNTWDGIFPALQSGKFDLVMSGVTITDKRKKTLAFSRPYLLSGQTIARRRGDESIKSSKDLKGKMVAVQVGTTGQEAAEKLGLAPDQIRKFETTPDALLELRNGRVVAAVGDMPVLTSMVRKTYPELEVVGGIFTDSEFCGIVLRRGEPELLEAVNNALAKIMADGRYARIYAKWVGEPLAPDALTRLDQVSDQGTAANAKAIGSAFSIRWELLRSTGPLLLQGAGRTLEITFCSLLIGIPLGLLIALGRLLPLRPISLLAMAYVEIVRGTPLLLQIFTIYFVLPAIGLTFSQFGAGVAALSLNGAAYLAEIFRAGIQSIDTGQMEAARSLGLSSSQAMRWVILPQTMRRVLPPLTNEAVALLKDSSLISIMGASELMTIARQQSNATGSTVTFFLAAGVLYLAMTLPLTFLIRRLEARFDPISRPRAKGQTAPGPMSQEGASR